MRSGGVEGKKLVKRSTSGTVLDAWIFMRALYVEVDGLTIRREEKTDFVSLRGGYAEVVDGVSENARTESRGEDLRISPGGGKESTRSYL